jgi:hypothetical protein
VRQKHHGGRERRRSAIQALVRAGRERRRSALQALLRAVNGTL